MEKGPFMLFWKLKILFLKTETHTETHSHPAISLIEDGLFVINEAVSGGGSEIMLKRWRGSLPLPPSY